MKLETEQLYECLCATLRKPLSQGASGLIASLKDETAESIAAALRKMTADEATLIFDWLDDDRAVDLLRRLDHDTAEYILKHAPPGRIAHLDLTAVDLPASASVEEDE